MLQEAPQQAMSGVCFWYCAAPETHSLCRIRRSVLCVQVIMEFQEPFWEGSVDYFGAAVPGGPAARGRCFMFWNLQRFAQKPILTAVVAGAAAEVSVDPRIGEDKTGRGSWRSRVLGPYALCTEGRATFALANMVADMDEDRILCNTSPWRLEIQCLLMGLGNSI